MYVWPDKQRFIIASKIVKDNASFLVCDFKFYLKKYNKSTEQTIRSSSHLALIAEDKIVSDRDYLDAAEELYLNIARGGCVDAVVEDAGEFLIAFSTHIGIFFIAA